MEVLIAGAKGMAWPIIAEAIKKHDLGATIVEASDRDAVLGRISAHPNLRVLFIEAELASDDQDAFFADVRVLAPGAVVALLFEEVDRDDLMQAIHNGAAGVLHQGESREQLTAAVRLILEGHVYFPRDLLIAGPSASAAPIEKVREEGALTPREREVLAWIGHGMNVARIADALALSPHTVRVHVTRIMKKLDLRDRSSLMHYAITRSHSPLPTAP